MRKQTELLIKEVHHIDVLASKYTQVMFEKHENLELRSLIFHDDGFPDLIPGDKLLVTISLIRPTRR